MGPIRWFRTRFWDDIYVDQDRNTGELLVIEQPLRKVVRAGSRFFVWSKWFWGIVLASAIGSAVTEVVKQRFSEPCEVQGLSAGPAENDYLGPGREPVFPRLTPDSFSVVPRTRDAQQDGIPRTDNGLRRDVHLDDTGPEQSP